MLSIIFSVVITIFFVVASCLQKKAVVAERSKRAIKPISIIIRIAPLIGLIVFSILFIWVLKGRLAERVAHSVIVFALWLCAVQFYQYIIAYFKIVKILIGSVVGMIMSVGMAILLTPLDRYVELQYSLMGNLSIVFSCVVFVVIYGVIWFADMKKN